MAGVKQFDVSEVLDRAMLLFWRRGYKATSIDDLLRATGISRGSLYATFHDKRRLFTAVLDHYAQKIGAPLLAELNDEDPIKGIEKMFAAIMKRNRDRALPVGCLTTNTSLECPDIGKEISEKIARLFVSQEAAIYQTLHRAEIQQRIPPRRDIRALARFFTGTAQALNVVDKATRDPSISEDIVRTAMSVLDQNCRQSSRRKRGRTGQ
jgi:TetR/AcrR family transcriptional regulator, transcriptional repressor for nem operon